MALPRRFEAEEGVVAEPGRPRLCLLDGGAVRCRAQSCCGCGGKAAETGAGMVGGHVKPTGRASR
eukprot:scaffold13359_cov111-Isochrysis_galbana.AAC.2